MIRIHYSELGKNYFGVDKIDLFDDMDEDKSEIIECIIKGLNDGYVVSIMDTGKVISFKDFI